MARAEPIYFIATGWMNLRGIAPRHRIMDRRRRCRTLSRSATLMEAPMQKTNETGIYQLKDGRYRVRATAKCPRTGKIVEAQRTMKHGQRMIEAREMREALKERLTQTDEAASQKVQISTVADYAERWIARKARTKKPSTVHEYERHLYSKILPHIGHIYISRLVRRDVSDWIAWCEVQTYLKGKAENKREVIYSTDTLRGWWRTMRCILKDAHAEGYIERDITSRLDPPDSGVRGRREKRTLSVAELGRLVQAAQTFTPNRYPEVVTLAYTGMRSGELWALQWDDVDLVDGQINVCRGLSKGISTDTKTHEPRQVPIPKVVTDALRSHRACQMAARPPGFETGLVFPSDVGRPRHHGSLRKTFPLLCEHLKLDVKVTPQVLRRTFNTLLVEAQIDRIVQRSIMGHSSEEMTQRYSGVRMDLKRTAINKIVPLIPTRDSAADNKDASDTLAELLAGQNSDAVIDLLAEQGVDVEQLTRDASQLTEPTAAKGG